MAKVWETNQEDITKMSPHRGKKCSDKNAMTKMRVHEDIGAKRTATILTCAGWALDRRQVGKNLSVHIRRPAASSYWKSNWSDTCIFELNEPGFSIHSFWVGVTPACKLGTETKNWTCDESPSEQGLPPHTHTHAPTQEFGYCDSNLGHRATTPQAQANSGQVEDDVWWKICIVHDSCLILDMIATPNPTCFWEVMTMSSWWWNF